MNRKKTVALLGLFVITFLAFHSVVSPNGRHFISMRACQEAAPARTEETCRHAFFGWPLK